MEPTWQPPTARDLLALAWPMILGRAAQSVVGFTDAVLVAPLGPDALAATGNGALNELAVFMLPVGVAFFVQSFAAQLSARGDAVRLRRYGWYGLGIAFLAQVVGVALVPAVPWLLARADYTPAVRALMGDYMALRLLGVGAAVGIEAIANWFGGQGNTRVGLAASVLVMGLNVPLAWLLIHGGFGLPAMGVRGAAIASILATAAGFTYALATFLRAGRDLPRPTWRWSEFRRVLRFGLPNGVNWFLEFASFLFFIDVVFARMGTTALAALMAVLQLNSIAFMPAFGLANAGAIHVGQALGAGRADAVRALVRRTMLAAAGWMLLVGTGYALTPRLLLAPFSPGSVAARTGFLAVGVPLLWVAVAWQLFDAATIVLGETLRAAGDTAWPMRVRIAISWGAFVPITLLTARWGGGPVAALSWVVAYMAALAALLARRVAGGAWRTVSLTGDEAGVVVD